MHDGGGVEGAAAEGGAERVVDDDHVFPPNVGSAHDVFGAIVAVEAFESAVGVFPAGGGGVVDLEPKDAVDYSVAFHDDEMTLFGGVVVIELVDVPVGFAAGQFAHVVHV